MSIRERAIERFGEPFVTAIARNAGLHSENRPPPEWAFLFGMLEAVDFECPKYDWACPGRVNKDHLIGVSLQQVKEFLWEIRAEVIAAPVPVTSWLGTMGGMFDFLKDEQPEETRTEGKRSVPGEEDRDENR